MLIYLMFLIFVFITVSSYLVLKKDVSSPVFIFSGTYSISILSAIFNVKLWNIHYQFPAFMIITGGGLLFYFISIFIFLYYEKKTEKVLERNTNLFINERPTFSISYIFLIILSVYSIAIIVILVQSVGSIADQFGNYSTFSQALLLFKTNTSYNLNAELPSYVTIMMKPVIAGAYLCSYVLAGKVVDKEYKNHKKFTKDMIFYGMPIVLYILLRFIESNRGSVITLCFSIISMFFILWNIKQGWSRPFPLKYLFFLIAIGIICLILFYLMAPLIGRVNDKDMIEYITFYLGGSIESFNRFMQSNERGKLFGAETFYHTIVNLDSIGIINNNLKSIMTPHLPFTYNGDIMIGNVYTAYRRWIFDFGITGAFILQTIMAFFFNIFYFKIKYMSIKQHCPSFLVILYSYLSYSLFMHFIDGYFFLETFTISTFATLVVLGLMYITFDKIKIEKPRENNKNKDDKWITFNF